MLSYQNEYCDLTLREGIDEYRDYLKKIIVMFWGKIALKQKN